MYRSKLVFLVVVGMVYSATTARAADLISVYTFDEQSGDLAADAIRGAAGDASLMNFDGSQWSPGFIGGGVSLDGADDWMRAVNPIVNGATAMSFSGWVKADTPPVWSSIVKNWGGAQAGQYHFGLQAGDGDLSNFLKNSDDSVNNIRESSPFGLDEWTHVAFTHGEGKHKLFKNGAKIAEADFSGGLNWPLNQQNDGTGILGIGVKTNDSGDAADPGAPGYWDGSFDDFGFWDGTLSEAEVETIYQNGLQGISVVPEPSSMSLVVLGLLCALGMRRR